MDTPDKLSYASLFDFSGANPITKATKSISELEAAYTQLATNLGEQSTKISNAQVSVAGVLEKLSAQINAVNISTENGRKSAAKTAQEIDNQTRKYDGLKAAQKGVTETNKSVSDSLAGLREQLKADREELTKLGLAANPEKIVALSKSISDTRVKSEQLEKAVRGVNSTFAAAKGSYNAIVNENRQLALELKNLGGVFDETNQKTAQATAREEELKAKLASNTQTLKNYDAQLNQHFRNVGNYADSIIAAVSSLKEEKAALTAQSQALKTATTATNLDAAAQDKLQKELAETQAKLVGVNAKLADYGHNADASQNLGQQLSGSIKNAGSNLKDFALNTITATVGLAAIASGIKEVIALNINYSDELADVAKTTGLTISQTADLAENLKKIDTRDSIDELLKISEIGGQLGIAKDDIEGFTKAIDTASIALKSDFGGDVELIATELGKINSIFKTSDSVGIERALLDIGSAVNELGAAGSATAPFITDYAKRVGSIAANAGLGLDKVLGLGASLEELGFSAEVAGTASAKLITGLSASPKGFFEIAKLADTNLKLKDFKSLVNNDINAALSLFLQGLNKGGTATTDFAKLIKSLKIEGTGTVSVLTALAKNTELVSDRQRIANEQLNNGNSLAKEAAIKNDNLAASYNKLKNSIQNVLTGDGAIGKALKGAFDFTTQVVRGNIDWKETLLSIVPLYDRIQLLRAGNIGAALALNPLPTIKIKDSAKAVEDYGLAVALASRATNSAATSAESLYSKYQDLAAVAAPNAAQQKELRTLTLKLQDALGDSVVVLDKERGQYVLNTDAVSKNITAKRNEVSENAIRLAQRVNQLDIELAKENALANAVKERLELAKGALSPAIKNPGSASANAFVAKQETALASPNQIYGTPQINAQDIANYEAYRKALDEVEKASLKASNTEHDRDMVLNRLKIIYPDLINVNELLAKAQKKTIEATLPDTASKKDLAKASRDALAAIDALAKAQYELAKFRAENRAGTFERQADNEANDEAFREKAAEKGAKKRIEVARLEANEKVRLAVNAARDMRTKEDDDLAKGTVSQQEYALIIGKINKTLSVQRTLISEQYAARIKEIDRDLSKEQLEIHAELLEQLREIDKVRIDSEQESLQKVIDNETLGYDVRTAAFKQYQDNVILLAKATYDGEVIAAKGSATKIKLAYDKLTTTIGAAQDKIKPFDSTIANDDTDINYKNAQIALEKTRALGLVTEEEYNKQRTFLEDKYLQEHLTNLQVEKEGTKQALDDELALLRKKKEEELAIEEEKKKRKIKIIEETTQIVGAIGNGLFERNRANIDNEIAAIAAQKENDVSLAGNNAAAKKKIEDKAARDTAELRRKQAVSERSQALFNIALNTGIAVTKAVADSPLTFGLPWSGFALANGVIQAALVLAKPIPAFAKGTEHSPAGLALVGEAGPELLQRNGVNKLVSSPTLVDLEAGTRVVNSAKTLQLFEERGLSMNLAEGYAKSSAIISSAQNTLSISDITRIMSAEMAVKFDTLKDAFQENSGVSFSFDKQGFNASITNGQRTNQIMRNRYHRHD